MVKVAVFASGSGTNAEELIKYFKNTECIEVSVIVSDNLDAFVLQRAKKFNIPSLYIPGRMLDSADIFSAMLSSFEVDFIILAGWLKLIPAGLIKDYEDKIVNIHPALLPKYGGKGMYGNHVHKAVIAAGEQTSGITVHYVNERYDEGNIIAQIHCAVSENDTPESLAEKIHKIEHAYYPTICETVIKDKFQLRNSKSDGVKN